MPRPNVLNVKKMTLLWTARISAEDMPAFVPHIGPSPSKKPTHFRLRLTAQGAVMVKKDDAFLPINIIKAKPEAPPQPMAVKIAEAIRQQQVLSAHVAQRHYNRQETPAQSTRTATALNRRK